MKLSTLFATTVLVASSTVSAQLYNSFINCISPAFVPAGSVIAAGSASSDTCVTECLTNNFRYAYFTTSSNLAGTTAGQSACSCSNTQPPIKGFTRTVDTVGDYTCNTPTDFQAFLLRTSNRFDGCSQGGGDRQPLKNGIQTTFESCLTWCVDYDTIYLQARPNSDGVSCWCQTAAVPPSTRCGTGELGNYYTIYRRTAGAVASGGLRKRSKGTYCDGTQAGGICDSSIYHETPQDQSLLAQEFCPAGQTACNVEGLPGAYECINTDTELESCGGCVAGEFGKANSTMGINCQTEVPRSIRSRVTCSSGSCLLY